MSEAHGKSSCFFFECILNLTPQREKCEIWNELVSSIDRTKLVTVEQLTDDIVAYRSQVVPRCSKHIHVILFTNVEHTVRSRCQHTCNTPYIVHVCTNEDFQCVQMEIEVAYWVEYACVHVRLWCLYLVLVRVCMCISLGFWVFILCSLLAIRWLRQKNNNNKPIDRYDFGWTFWNFLAFTAAQLDRQINW